MNHSLRSSVSLLSTLAALALAACGSAPVSTDAGRRDAASALDAPVPSEDAPASADDAPGSSDDAAAGLEDAPSLVDAPRLEDAFVAPLDSGPQRDAGPAVACGGRGTPPCVRGTFCNFPPSSICGRADGPGVCEAPPAACSRELAPVCGCDGVTYSNACMAAMASVSVDFTGPCPVSCDARRVLCDRIPPRCAMGEAPSVSGSCWGDCVPVGECTCTTTDECPMIRGVSEVCYSRGVCGPLL